MRRDDAVAPVLGTVLLVAIAVAMAAALAVAITLMTGQKSTDVPAVAVSPTETEDRLVVRASTSGVLWEHVEIRLSQDGGWSMEPGPVSGTPAGTWERMSGGPVLGGESVYLCADVQGPMMVELRHLERSLLLTQSRLSNVAACPP